MLLAMAGLHVSCGSEKPELKEQRFRASSYHEYRYWTWNDALELDWVTTRPEQTDGSVWFCVAAAFTRAGDFSIDGVYANNNGCQQRGAPNQRISGGLIIQSGNRMTFTQSPGGHGPEDVLCERIASTKADFFQQFTLVVDGNAEGFSDRSLFIRRALVQLADGRAAIVESAKQASLSQFALDLVEMGAQQAIYLDMGAYDEGWFRYGDATIALGRSRTETARQSNWLILRQH